ncbi:MAG: hypothetical protein AAF741_01435 [Bacteroidota bacterium]
MHLQARFGNGSLLNDIRIPRYGDVAKYAREVQVVPVLAPEVSSIGIDNEKEHPQDEQPQKEENHQGRTVVTKRLWKIKNQDRWSYYKNWDSTTIRTLL